MSIHSRAHRCAAAAALGIPGAVAALMLHEARLLLVPAFTMIIAATLLTLFSASTDSGPAPGASTRRHEEGPASP